MEQHLFTVKLLLASLLGGAFSLAAVAGPVVRGTVDYHGDFDYYTFTVLGDLGAPLQLFLDTDGDPATGYSNGTVAGADRLVELYDLENLRARVYAHRDEAGSGWSWDQGFALPSQSIWKEERALHLDLSRGVLGLSGDPADDPIRYRIQRWDASWTQLLAAFPQQQGMARSGAPVVIGSQARYAPGDALTVQVAGDLSHDADWVGLYPAGADNRWANVVAWNWVSLGSNLLEPVAQAVAPGDYEVRLFFHNSYETEASAPLVVEAGRPYGVAGSHEVSVYWEKDEGESVVYYPSDISLESPTPLLFFCPGWNSRDPADYDSLLRFIASHGYSVIYAKDNPDYSARHFLDAFEKMLDSGNDVLPYVDTSRIGVIGHSSGGGDSFRVLQYFSAKGYGANGRFLMALDPWFAFDMTAAGMRSLPANTHVVIVQFGPDGGETDPRIPLSEYALLESIDPAQKDYQVYLEENADHGYPTGSRPYAQMQGVLRPLDALMAWVFEGEGSAYGPALTVGSDRPLSDGLQQIREIWSYDYPCNGHANQGEVLDIRYCSQYQGL